MGRFDLQIILQLLWIGPERGKLEMKFALIVCSALALAVPAQAEDQFGWTGPYIGVETGFNALNFDAHYTDNTFKGSGGTATPSFGGQAGYNFQNGKIVYGFEVDANFMGYNQIDVTAKDTYAAQSDWYGTARGRIGVANGRGLVYATGGLALSKVDIQDSLFISSNTLSPSMELGWVAGAGIEYAVNDKISLKGEFLHLDYGTLQSTDFFNGAPVQTHYQDNVVRLGLNFHF